MNSVSAFLLWMRAQPKLIRRETTQAVAEKKLRTSIQQFRQLLGGQGLIFDNNRGDSDPHEN